MFLFEHIGWTDDPLNFTSFFAWVICFISAIMYLSSGRAAAAESVETSSATRTLAYIAIAVAGGFLLHCAIVVVLVANSMKDF